MNREESIHNRKEWKAVSEAKTSDARMRIGCEENTCPVPILTIEYIGQTK